MACYIFRSFLKRMLNVAISTSCVSVQVIFWQHQHVWQSRQEYSQDVYDEVIACAAFQPERHSLVLIS